MFDLYVLPFALVVSAAVLIAAAVRRALRDAPTFPSEESDWGRRDRSWIEEWEQSRTPEAVAERTAARLRDDR